MNIESNGTPTLTDRVKELRLTGKMETGPAPRTGTSWMPWLLCFLLALGWAGYGVKAYKPAKKVEDAPGPTVAGGPPTAGNLAANSAAFDSITLEVKGYLIPTQSIKISPVDVAGRVIKLNIEEGKSFKKDDILAELDSTPFQWMQKEAYAQMMSAKARLAELQSGNRPEEIEQAAAELEDAKAQLQQARREWERFETQKTTAITTREYEQAEAAFRSGLKRVEARQKAYDLMRLGARKERIDASIAEYESAQARLKQAEWKLQNCTIKSPVTGVILTKNAEIGSLLNPVVGGISTNLCDIADLRKLEVDLEVSERDIGKIRLGQACKIKPDAYPDRSYEGYVERVMPVANRGKSIVPVRIKVVPRDDEQQGQYLKPEMSVTVTFVNRTVTDEYRVKVQKLLDDDTPKK